MFNLKGIKIHIVTINIGYNLQMHPERKPVSSLCSTLTLAFQSQSLRSSIPYVTENSKDIWIPILWRNVYLATEYMLKRNNLQQQFHYIFLSGFLVPIWNAMTNTDAEQFSTWRNACLWAHTLCPWVVQKPPWHSCRKACTPGRCCAHWNGASIETCISHCSSSSFQNYLHLFA